MSRVYTTHMRGVATHIYICFLCETREVTLVRRSVSPTGARTKAEAARTGCGLRGSGSGAPQAGRKAVGGSEGGAGDSILGPLGGSAARSACPNPENPPQNGSFSFVADPEAPFLPILPQDLSAVAPAAKIFRSQGSKSDPVLHIQYPPAWADVAENGGIRKWRCLLQISRKRLVGDK